MAISATLTAAPAAPNHGDTVTATYTVTGNNPVAPQSAAVGGEVTVGSQPLNVSTTVTLPGTPALPEVFTVPTCAGLTFTGTSNPAVFTAVVP